MMSSPDSVLTSDYEDDKEDIEEVENEVVEDEANKGDENKNL